RVPLAVRTLPLARAAAPRRRRARARAGRRAGRVAAGRVLARDCILPAGARAGRAGGGAVRRGRLRGAARRRPSASPLSGASEGRLYRRRAGARAGSPMRAPGPGMRRTSVGGFTLVELLVALAVAGIVALAAQQPLATALDARARSRTQRELALSSAARRAALEAWLRGATLSVPGEPFIGRPGGDVGWPADELVFAVADAGALYPGPHRIRVWVDRNPALAPEDGLAVELLPLPAGSGPADTLVLAPAAARLRIDRKSVV